jgi:LemA protein
VRRCPSTLRVPREQFLNPFKITAHVAGKLILVNDCRHRALALWHDAHVENDLHPIDIDQASRAMHAYADDERNCVKAAPTTMKSTSIISLLLGLLLLASCGINPSMTSDREVKAAFADVLDQYGQRLDLAADVSALARKYLPADSLVLAQADDSREAVASLHVSPEFVDTPASFERFDIAQRQLTEAISQLMVACEGVRRLNNDPKFRVLQSRLATSAGRIALARDRYDDAARRYNASLRHFSSGVPFNLAEAIRPGRDKPTFSVKDGSPVHRHPRTDFGSLRGSLRV